MQLLLANLISIYIIVLIGRAILSWFPQTPGTALASVSDFLTSITEPALRPLRRILPPTGMFDLSFIVLIFGLSILRNIIAGG